VVGELVRMCMVGDDVEVVHVCYHMCIGVKLGGSVVEGGKGEVESEGEGESSQGASHGYACL
jgi:hypothetical protein